MPSSLADTIARLRALLPTGRPIPADLIRDAIHHLEQSADVAARRAERNRLIRLAALFMPTGGPYTQARRLEREAREMNRVWPILCGKEPSQPFENVRDCLHAARQAWDIPVSARQYYRLLSAANTDMEGGGDVSGLG